MIDPLQEVIAELETILAKLHALKPQVQQSIADAQQVDQTVKEAMVGIPVTYPILEVKP